MKKILLLIVLVSLFACKKNGVSLKKKHTITYKAWGGPGNNITYNDGSSSINASAGNASTWQIQKEVPEGKNVSISATNNIPGTYVGVSIMNDGNQVAYLVGSQGSSVSYTVK